VAPKYQQVRDSLFASIQSGVYAVDSKLPTIAEMSTQFGASYVTTQRAYRLLADEGIISLTKGPTGSRVVRTSSRLPVQPLTIAGLFRASRQRNQYDDFALDMFESVCDSLSKQRASILHHRLNVPNASEEVLRCVEEGAVDGVILDQVTPDEFVHRVHQTGHPAVIYNRHPEQPVIDSVCPDLEWVACETVRRALAAGYQKIVYCNMWHREAHSDPEGRARIYTNETHLEGILAELRRNGFPDAQCVVTYEPPPEDVTRWNDLEFFCNHLHIPAEPNGERTLYVTHDDPTALRIHETLLARGFCVPDDAGVIGLFDYECNRSAARPVTTWHICPEEVGRVAVETLTERIEFPDRARVQRYLKPTYVDRGTF
jgi:DNA-binding LacI/PurR family transcriptional regulator